MKAIRLSPALIFSLAASMAGAANAQDACIHPDPPVGYLEQCTHLDDPADLETPDFSYIDTMIDGLDDSYASKSHPNLCIDKFGERTAWKEKKFGSQTDEVLERQALFQRPKYSRGIKLPLIIWAHPTGQKEIPPLETYKAVADGALRNGFAFLSIEYRHPTSSRTYPGLPPAPPLTQDYNGDAFAPFCAWDSTDIAAAIQWARQHATQLQIDRQGIYVVGQSRGSLGLLTAYMPDQKDPAITDLKGNYRGHSSKPRAVFMAQAQVTYDTSQLRQIFMRQRATQAESDSIYLKNLQFPLCKSGNPAVFDYHCHWSLADQVINPRPSNLLSALDQYDASDPPAWLRYEKSPPSTTSVVKLPGYVQDAGDDQTNMQESDDCYGNSYGCLDVHHPNFGVELRRRATQIGAKNVVVQYAPTGGSPALEAVAASKFFDNYHCFFIGYKPLGAPEEISNMNETTKAARLDAVKSYKKNKKQNDPEPGSLLPCFMDEAIPWNWN